MLNRFNVFHSSLNTTVITINTKKHKTLLNIYTLLCECTLKIILYKTLRHSPNVESEGSESEKSE